MPFAELGAGALRTSLEGLDLNRALDDAIGHIMAGFGELSVHDDVMDGLPALVAIGARLVTLSNGARIGADQLLARAGLGRLFELLLSVEDAGVWKPAPGAYA